MLTRRRTSLAIAAALIAPLALVAAVGRQEKPETVADADRYYAEGSYARALPVYEGALKDGKVGAGREDEVRYRVVVSLGKTQQWDRAISETFAFLSAHQRTVWEPRALYWLGRLSLGAKHDGYQIGDRLYRTDNVPKTDSAEAPQRVWVSERDSRNAIDALEAARVFFPSYRSELHTEAEEIQLNFDIVTLLTRDRRYQTWLRKPALWQAKDPAWRVDLKQPYDPQWPAPKKALYLLDEIDELAAALPADKSAHTRALGLFAKALWLRQYETTVTPAGTRYESGKAVRVPHPYAHLKGAQALRDLVRLYPNDPVRDQAQYTVCLFRENDGDRRGAEAEYKRFVAQRPRSKWVEDALYHVAAMNRRSVTLTNTPSVVRPCAQVALGYETTNVKRVRFQVFRVRPEQAAAALLDDKQANRERDLTSMFDSTASVRRFCGERIAEWSVSVPDRGDHQTVSGRTTIPVKSAGAYAVEATADGASAVHIVLVTDLALVIKTERDRAVYFAANLSSGSYVPNAAVLLRIGWTEDSGSHSVLMHGRTNAEGLGSVDLPRAPGRRSFRVSALAFVGDRYALTGSSYGQDYTDNPGTWRTYVVTDRAVYRPGQTVHYRQIVLRRDSGDWKPWSGRKIGVRVHAPQTGVVFEADRMTNEFGAVSGDFTLASDARLGQYSVGTQIEGQPNDGGDQYGTFRVEEYRKPEFEVKVEPSADRVRVGQKAGATVRVRYYFGGPVVGASVSYRVYREPWSQSYRFPRPFDFLYDDQYSGYRGGYGGQQEIVAQGTAATDAKGVASVAFETSAAASRWSNTDMQYRVEADVQDASRRVVSGGGAVKATRHPIAVLTDFARGYAVVGEHVDVEVMTLTPSGAPTPVSGTARVYKQPVRPKEREAQVWEQPLKTDERGRAYIRWVADHAGQYRIAFETPDTEAPPPTGKGRPEDVISGSSMVWVQGPELAKQGFLFTKVELIAKELYYTEGQTAKFLLLTPEPGCTVLLTREANNEILDKRIVTVPGRSIEVEAPITRRDVPNVYFSVAMVRDGSMHTDTREVFTPPARQFANVTVSVDRTRYAPGEPAQVRVKAVDADGKPLRADVSVAVTDAALEYIQQDVSPDIRAYYYGARRSMRVATEGSTWRRFGTYADAAPDSREYTPHRWLPPDGMGMLADWPGSGGGNYSWRNAWDSVAWYGVPRRGRGMVMAGMGGGFGGGGFGGGRGGGMMDSVAAYDVDNTLIVRKDDEAGLGSSQQVRTRFADTAFWAASVATGADGTATVEVTCPENLTEWRAVAVGITAEAQVGRAEARFTTTKDLIVRLQAPRFVVQRDEIVLSANIHNFGPADLPVEVGLDLFGDCAELAAEGQAAKRNAKSTVTVPKGGEKRVDWLVRAVRSGDVKVRVSARGGGQSDATETTVPVLVHGVERMTAQSGVMRGERTTRLSIDLPEARRSGSAELMVRLNPSLATVAVDALPYLVHYPYGCIEQTMSRFMPTVVTAQALKEAGYDLETLGKRARAQAEREQGGAARTYEGSPYTYPRGRPGAAQHEIIPPPPGSGVFDTDMLQGMVRAGLDKVRQWQHSDGGWGWWPNDRTDITMTCYVVDSLLTAMAAKAPVDVGVFVSGMECLKANFVEDDDLHRMAYEARVLARGGVLDPAITGIVTGRLFDRREQLSAYSKALLAMALYDLGDRDKAAVLLRNIESTAIADEANGTANWEGDGQWWWRWWNNKVETNAAVLQAMVKVDPASRLAPMVVKWLVNNRRGSQWHSTRETAMAIYAIMDYARANKELAPDMTVTLDLDGRVQRKFTINRDNALLFDNAFVVPDDLLQTGGQKLTITREGTGSLYYSAFTRYFSLEEPIKAAGGEISVARRYFRVVAGTETNVPRPVRDAGVGDLKRPNPFILRRYELANMGEEGWSWYMSPPTKVQRVELHEGDVVKSGDRIEVEIGLESKNDYDYLVFEDMKPAGCEPVEVQSGGKAGLGVYSYMELRDQKVAFFIGSMPQGRRTITYQLWAETPGKFHVLPANGYAMYAPDIRTISDEWRMEVR